MWICLVKSLLIAPVQAQSDVTLHLAALLLSHVTQDQLTPQVHQLVHHMPQLLEELHSVLLFNQRILC